LVDDVGPTCLPGFKDKCIKDRQDKAAFRAGGFSFLPLAQTYEQNKGEKGRRGELEARLSIVKHLLSYLYHSSRCLLVVRNQWSVNSDQ
jgi:hypothetical protein